MSAAMRDRVEEILNAQGVLECMAKVAQARAGKGKRPQERKAYAKIAEGARELSLLMAEDQRPAETGKGGTV